jgi:hypothetical protein
MPRSTRTARSSSWSPERASHFSTSRASSAGLRASAIPSSACWRSKHHQLCPHSSTFLCGDDTPHSSLTSPEYEPALFTRVCSPRIVPYLHMICGQGFRMDHGPTILTMDRSVSLHFQFFNLICQIVPSRLSLSGQILIGYDAKKLMRMISVWAGPTSPALRWGCMVPAGLGLIPRSTTSIATVRCTMRWSWSRSRWSISAQETAASQSSPVS